MLHNFGNLGVVALCCLQAVAMRLTTRQGRPPQHQQPWQQHAYTSCRCAGLDQSRSGFRPRASMSFGSWRTVCKRLLNYRRFSIDAKAGPAMSAPTYMCTTKATASALAATNLCITYTSTMSFWNSHPPRPQ